MKLDMTNKDNTSTPIDSRKDLEKLNSGLLILYFQREIEDSSYAVIGRMTFGHIVVQRRQSYVSELIRVLEELELTAELLKEVDINATKKINGKTKLPEDIIEYYNGVFLGLVHQAKDKLLRFLDYMAANENIKTEYKEADKVKVEKHKEILDQIGILELVNAWKQNDGPIGVILKKRTQHHHRISTTRLNSDLQKLKMTRTVLSAPEVSSLNEAGKKYMEELGKDSFEKYRDDIVQKQKHAFQLIDNNLNAIAERVITHYTIPHNYVSQAKLANEYMEYLSSLNIINEATVDKIPKKGILSVDNILKLANDLGDEVISIYGVGSYFRDEFYEGSSDINLYVITKNTTKVYESELPVTLHVLSEKDFLSDDYKKEQFICWSDGALVYGKQHKWSENDFPKPGTMLSMLLNRGIIELLESIEEEVKSMQNPTNLELRLVELRATKKMLDYLFGIAISNKPLYSASRKRKIEHIKEVFGVQPLTLTLERIYHSRGKIVRQDNFCEMMDAYLKTARKNYAKQKKIEEEVLAKK